MKALDSSPLSTTLFLLTLRVFIVLWVLLGFVAGLVTSSFMIFIWFYRLRKAMAKKGFVWTSRFWVLTWIAMFSGSLIGFVRELKIMQEGSIIDSMLLYTSAILYWIVLLALTSGLMFDVLRRTKMMIEFV